MKTWKIVLPLGLAAAGAAAALLLKKKPGTSAPAKAAPKAAGKPGKAAKPAAPADEQSASYSFISGFKDAATVELTLRYDAAKFAFTVASEDFLSYSSDSHVALFHGEEFSLQLEYAGYYSGEDWAAHRKALAEKYRGLKDVSYGANSGVCYLDGDNLCLCFPIPGDAYSYVLATLLKAKDNDDELPALLDYDDVKLIFSSMSFARK